MKNIKLIFIGVLLPVVAAAMFFFQSCEEEKPIEVTGNIEGTVTDYEKAEVLSGVTVSIVSSSNTTFSEQSKLTGSDGKFSFKDLEAGNYKLSFSKNNYEDNSKNISLTAGQTSSGDIALKPVKSALSVTPAFLDFGVENNILPVEIRNTGRGELNWSIAEDLTWLSVNPTSGRTTTEPTSLTVRIDRTLITENSKTGSFVISSNGGSAVVSVSVGKAGPVLNVTPASLEFGSIETEISLNIKNVGKETLTYNASTSQSWISLSNAQGSTTTEIKNIKVTVNRTGLSTGEYSGSVAVNSNSNSVSIPVTMSVVQPTAPETLNGEVSGLTYNAAQVSGNILSVGSQAVTQHGHCWSASSNPTISDSKTTLGGTSVAKAFVSNLTGLTPSTTYYVKAYATNSVGTTYSEAVTFTTLALPTTATVQTVSTSNVKYNSVDVAGNLTVLGDGQVSDYGFCYSASNNAPTTSDSKASKGQTSQPGQYTATLADLQPLTKYYIRAYAVNSMGTAYGSTLEVTTADAPPAPPVVTGGLAAYYTFDDGTVTDVTGNGYDGAAINSPEFITNTPSGTGKAVFLKASGGQKLTLSNPVQNTNAYAISLWLKDVGTGSIFNGDGSPLQDFLGLSTTTNGQIRVNNDKNYDGANILQDGNWHHVVSMGLYDSFLDSWNIRLYIDNVLYGSDTNANVADWYVTYKVPTVYVGGAVSDFSVPANTFKVDNIRFYGRALTTAEITQIYNAKQ
jgi:hypothetical protein